MAHEVAFHWNREQRGIWSVPLTGGSEPKLIHELTRWGAMPIGWSRDGAWVYVLDEHRIMRMPRSGGKAEEVLRLPFEDARIEGASLGQEGSRLVVQVVDVQSDAWLVENFDAESRPRP